MKSTPYITGNAQYLEIRGKVSFNIASEASYQNQKIQMQHFQKQLLFFLGGIETKEEESYSKLRTSKVMYMNELLVPEAMRLSKKVEQVTRFKLKDDKYGSENFQVMNYGIGGRISTHLDSVGGRTKDTSEAEEVGGFRVTTFIVYI